MTQQRSRILLGAGLAALFISSAAAGAGAAGLIGSRDIADDSIRSVDIKNGTITGRDVKNGSLSLGDLPVGASGPDRIVTWTGTYIADGSTGGETPLVTSTDTVPAHSLVRGLEISVTGDRSTCTSNFMVWVNPAHAGDYSSDNSLAVAYWNTFGGDQTRHVRLDDAVTPTESAPHLQVRAACAGDSGVISVPSFEYAVTFSITRLATPAPTAFH